MTVLKGGFIKSLILPYIHINTNRLGFGSRVARLDLTCRNLGRESEIWDIWCNVAKAKDGGVLPGQICVSTDNTLAEPNSANRYAC